MANPNTNALMETALEIAQERRDTLAKLRAALEHGDDVQALQFARRLCGLTNDQESHRINPRLN